MKKEYVSPSICVENVKLSAFCDAGCAMSQRQKDEIIDAYVQAGYGSVVGGVFYCYNGSADINAVISSMAIINS